MCIRDRYINNLTLIINMHGAATGRGDMVKFDFIAGENVPCNESGVYTPVIYSNIPHDLGIVYMACLYNLCII